ARVDEPLRGGDEVVEHVLLAPERARLVPGVAVLAAATEVRQREDAARLEPLRQRRDELGDAADPEAAVARQERRGVAAGLQALAVDDEHRDRRAVPRGVRDLLDLDGVGVHGGLRLLPELERALRVPDVEAVDGRWVGEARER